MPLWHKIPESVGPGSVLTCVRVDRCQWHPVFTLYLYSPCFCFIDYDLEYFTSDTEAREKRHKIHHESQHHEFHSHLRRILS